VIGNVSFGPRSRASPGPRSGAIRAARAPRSCGRSHRTPTTSELGSPRRGSGGPRRPKPRSRRCPSRGAELPSRGRSDLRRPGWMARATRPARAPMAAVAAPRPRLFRRLKRKIGPSGGDLGHNRNAGNDGEAAIRARVGPIPHPLKRDRPPGRARGPVRPPGQANRPRGGGGGPTDCACVCRRALAPQGVGGRPLPGLGFRAGVGFGWGGAGRATPSAAPPASPPSTRGGCGSA
jgi:hypothetical protein